MNNRNFVMGASLALTLVACSSVRTETLENGVMALDDFEGPELSPIWRTDKFEPGRVQIQSTIVRSGKQALRIDVLKGDKFEPGDRESLPSERDELCEARNLESLEGAIYEYAFSIFIPDDIPIVPVRLNLAQWKQRCAEKKCDPENALIGVQYINGKLAIKHQYGRESEKLFSTSDYVRNRWLDFVFRIKFSHQPDGRIETWLDGKKIIDYTGFTAFIDGVGYPKKNTYYFKMGLYRDQMDQPMTAYFDRYSKRQITVPNQTPGN